MNQENKIIARDLSKMKTSNISDGEFKEMILKIFTGLDNRVENISETQHRNKKESEIKKIITEIKNTLDEINRPEE